jgi:hypothetical protein
MESDSLSVVVYRFERQHSRVDTVGLATGAVDGGDHPPERSVALCKTTWTSVRHAQRFSGGTEVQMISNPTPDSWPKTTHKSLTKLYLRHKTEPDTNPTLTRQPAIHGRKPRLAVG